MLLESTRRGSSESVYQNGIKNIVQCVQIDTHLHLESLQIIDHDEFPSWQE